MDQQASSLIQVLKRPAAPSEAKLSAFNSLKSDIKHYRVPESAQATIFECIKLGITQQASASLALTAFSTFGHLLKRLKIQDNLLTITHLSPRLYGAITERLSDLREQVRTAASNSLAELWSFLPQDVEKIVREDVIGGSNVRAKETGMVWVARMHRDENMPFKAFVSSMVACLEDADGTVRDAARNSLVELFREAPERAKLDLKRQLKAHSVRHAIESHILAQIGSTQPLTAAKAEEPELASSTKSLPPVSKVEAETPPPAEPVQLDPLYVHSERELNDMFRDMTQFEGRESEQNWMPRDKAVLKIRRLLKGNAPSDYHQAFMTSLKGVMEGILKVANSLRTTTSSNGCQLVQELAQTLGPALDSQVEILLQSFIKMSAATKHIASENGKATCDAIFQHCSYHVRLMQHVWTAAQDKNAQTRQCTPKWLRTLLERQAGHKTHFESSGGLELAEKCIKKGLDDANPKVKEAMRATYWTFARTWPDKAEVIMNKLDPKSKAMLEKDSNNPNAALFQSMSGSRPPITSRPSALKELMAEQRRANSRNMTDRPSSAMATVTPARRADGPSTNRATSKSRLQNEARPPTKGSLASGPVRRPKREIQRPLTADPYASRRLARPETPSTLSSAGSPGKSSIPTSSAHRMSASREASPTVARRAVNARFSRPTSKDSTASFHAAEVEHHSRIPLRSPVQRPHDGGLLPAMDDITPISHRRNLSEALSTTSQSPETRSPLKVMIDAAREKLDRPAESVRSPRAASPSKVAVYEDPISEPSPKPQASQQQVLVEKTPNENVSLQSPTQNSPASPSSSDRTEVLRNRRLLASGIERMKGCTLDAHGFRRVQDLVKSTSDVWEGGANYDELMSALLTYLQAFATDSRLSNLSASKMHGLKVQALGVLRALLTIHPKHARIWFGRALTTVLTCRKQVDSIDHVVADLEKTADEILRLSSATPCIDATIEYLADTDDEAAGTAMALYYLRLLVVSASKRKELDLGHRTALTQLAGKFLEHADAEVRKNAVDLASQIYDLYDGDEEDSKAEFWQSLDGVDEGRKGLLTYYIARRAKQ